MKTIEAISQPGGFNQRLPIRQSDKCFPYSGHHQHKDDAIDTFLSSVRSHDGTTAVEFIVGAKTLLTDVNAMGSKSGLNIFKVLKDRFRKRGVPINIWSDNAQEESMGSVHKLL